MRIRGTFQESQQSRDIQQLTGLSSIVFKKKRQKSTPAVAIAISHTERFFVCPPWREYLFFFNHSPRGENSVPRRIVFVFSSTTPGGDSQGGKAKKVPSAYTPISYSKMPKIYAQAFREKRLGKGKRMRQPRPSGCWIACPTLRGRVLNPESSRNRRSKCAG